MPPVLKAPMPYFGKKDKVAPEVWKRFGNVRGYIEPFFGSGAVLLARPHKVRGIEVANDRDGNIVNFWRAIQANPDAVASWADWPVTELDRLARHRWLCREEDVHAFVEKLVHDPDWYDVKRAGWWVWGVCSSIGGTGTWCHDAVYRGPGDERGIKAAGAMSIGGRGVNAFEGNPTLREASMSIRDRFRRLQERFRFVHIRCGDWRRCVSDSVARMTKGYIGVFLDPPYSREVTPMDQVYAGEKEGGDLRGEVEAWCAEHGKRREYRIAVCGYEGEYKALEKLGWRVYRWTARGGFANQIGRNRNKERERIWFSRHCREAVHASP